MGDDTPEACCAAGICCDRPKQAMALAKFVRHAAPGVSHDQADQVAVALQITFDLVPKGLVGDFIRYVQTHPYE